MSDTMHIPMFDLRRQYRAYEERIDGAVTDVLNSGSFILGSHVSRFESEFAHYLGAGHAFGVGSGTDALELILRSCEVTAGDHVFTVANTAVATVAAIELCGAKPVFVDIDPVSYTMSAESLEAAVAACDDQSLKAILPVHLYGHPADMRAIGEVAGRHGLLVVEDCAQSHGARLAGRITGTWGDLSAFSFYPTKNLGGFGDGGMVVTDSSQHAEEVALHRQYGWRDRNYSIRKGMNTRLDELQAAILREILKHLDTMNNRRRVIAAAYSSGIENDRLSVPAVPADVYHVYHQYVVNTPWRDELQKHLKENGIESAIHYPVPLHLQPAYCDKCLIPFALEHTERQVERILSLPIHPTMTDTEVNRVIDVINSWEGITVNR